MTSLLWAGKTPAEVDSTGSSPTLYNGTARTVKKGERKRKVEKVGRSRGRNNQKEGKQLNPSRRPAGVSRTSTKQNTIARANYMSAAIDSRLMPSQFAIAIADERSAVMAELSSAKSLSTSPTKMSWSQLQNQERYPINENKSDDSTLSPEKNLLELKPNWVGVHHIVATSSATAGDVAWASRLRQSPRHGGRNIVAGTTPPRKDNNSPRRKQGGGGGALRPDMRKSSMLYADTSHQFEHVKAKIDTGRRSHVSTLQQNSSVDTKTNSKPSFNKVTSSKLEDKKQVSHSAQKRIKEMSREKGPLKETSAALKNIDKLTSRLEAFSSQRGPGKLRRFYLSVFKQFRDLEAQNKLLRETVRSQDNELKELKDLADVEKSKAMALEIEVSRVNAAAKELRSTLDPSFDDKISGGGGLVPRDLLLRNAADESLDEACQSEQWIRQGLIEIFCRFDIDNDGILSCEELNNLREALGSPAPPLTVGAFDAMCREHGLNRSRGGLSIDGFLDMYKLTGREAALTDIEALGITLGPLLFPRQALAEATRRLVEAREALHKSQQREIDMAQIIKAKNDRMQLAEARLREANSSKRSAQNERESAVHNLSCLQQKFAAERESHREGIRREGLFQTEIVKLQRALNDMKKVLGKKIEERDYYHEKARSLEESAEVANATARSAKSAENRMKKEKMELARKNQVLYMTLTNRQKQYGRISHQGVSLSDGTSLDGKVLDGNRTE